MSTNALLEDRLGGAPGFDSLGLSPTDRDKLSYLIQIDVQKAREYLEHHFDATFEQIAGEIEETKRYNSKVEKMTEALNRFQLHFPLWLNTERNQKTILRFLSENGLNEFNYKILAAMYEELGGVEGALDLDETPTATPRHYVGQQTPGAEFDRDYVPPKSVSAMSADEFSKAIARSPKFRQMIDGE